MSALSLIRGLCRTLSFISPWLAAHVAAILFSRPMASGGELNEATRLRVEGIIAQASIEPIELAGGTALLYRWPSPEIHARRVLVVHGWTSCTDYMLDYVEALREAGFEVAAMDFPAHGRAPGKCLEQPTAVAAIQAARDKLAPLHAQVGHSFGGAMSMMSLRAPDQQPSTTSPQHLVLVSSPSALEAVLDRFSQQIGLSMRATVRLKKAIADRIGLPLSELGASTAASFYQGQMTVIHSRDDREIPFADAVEIAAAFPGATLHAMDSLGHRRILKSPEVTRHIIAALGMPQGSSRQAS